MGLLKSNQEKAVLIAESTKSMDDPEKMIEKLKSALEHDSNCAEAWLNIGIAHIAMSRNFKSKHYHLKNAYMALDRYVTICRQKTGIVETAKKVSEECKEDFGKWNEILSKNINISIGSEVVDCESFNIGSRIHRLGNYKLAIECYGGSFTRSFYSFMCDVGKSECYYKLGNKKEALKSCDRALSICPEMKEAYLRLANVYSANLREFDKSIELFDRAIKLSPDDYNLYYQKGIIELAAERNQSARNTLKKSLNYIPYNEQDIIENINMIVNIIDSGRKFDFSKYIKFSDVS